ncbi:MAG TPA: ABC transporter permease [Actinomycetota bacterium]|nr:ABC transporter permease [Actinomycetota bacterium]
MSELIQWFSTTETIPEQLVRHLYLSYVPAIAAFLLALPVGLYIGHARRFEFIAITLANLGRAVPSFAILSLALIVFLEISPEHGLGFWPTFAALFFLSVPPILVNTHIGVKNVDPDTVEAARGLGYPGGRILREIELPLAAPLIVTGMKTAAVQSVATATLGAFVGAEGLGEFIRLGIRTQSSDVLLGGAILVALLAIMTEALMSILERWVRPRIRRDVRTRPDAYAPASVL